MTARDRVLAMTAAAAVVLCGCGGSGDGGTAASGDTAAGSPAATAVSPTENTDAVQPAPLVIDITVEGGEVTPTNVMHEAAVGQPIELRVDSDSADELHVHSTPEHTFDVGVGPGQTYRFTVDMPGRVDVELHDLHKTVATIQVR
ncbi:hypothetical protein [Mycolicibacterium hippocampi]|uniref:hypothetical protein n=1 Tax=Mycolicibacterium hippocampi TaxID=659824 RepID=UPI0035162ED2